MESNDKPSAVKIWLIASRPKTLPAATAPVVAASALAWYDGSFRASPAIACLLVALLLQIAANLANDLFDFQRGTDTPDRLGPLRVTQAGLLTPGQVKIGLVVCFAISSFLGIYVASVSSWLILLVGVLAIFAALTYSGGPLPYGYYGLGELGVFIFFGLAAVCGTYYAQAVTLTPAVFLIASAMGLLSTGILVVNNLRDINTDKAGGKKTLSVLFGATFTKREYFVLITMAYLIPAILWFFFVSYPWVLLPYLSLPLAFRAYNHVNKQAGRDLNSVLAETGRLELVYAILLGIGLIFSR